MSDVAEHEETKSIEEFWIDPEHAHRQESEAFEKNRQQLINEGHGCYICGSNDKLQAHHFGVEWSLWNECDPDRLSSFLRNFDPYGYSEKLKDQPITSPDDIRNLLILCEQHHIGKETKNGGGIHEMTFPIWIMQKNVKKESLLFVDQ